jgi:hypothetical protein
MDGIFQNGFQKKDLSSKKVTPTKAPKFKQSFGFLKAPDVITTTAVCVTKDFFAAPIFPVEMDVFSTWVYVLDLDVTKMYNTQERQHQYVRDLAEGGHISGPGVGDALWPMFGQERAVDEIQPGEVIGAVKVMRAFHGDSVLQGGTFFCLAYEPNANYAGALDGTTADAVAGIMQKYITGRTHLKMPSQAQGIVAAYKG